MKRFLKLCIIGVFVFLPQTSFASDVQKITTAKGITAWLGEDHSLPIISFAFAWRGGIEQDAPDKQGLSYLAAAMLGQGAGADDENAFQKKLDDNAISLSFQAQRDNMFGRLHTLKETLPLAKELLRNSLMSPRFEQKSLDRLRDQTLSTLKHYQSDPDWLMSRLMIREIFAGHVYSKRTLGTEATLKSITRNDIVAWHKNLGRDELIVSVTGDITKDELSAFLDDTLGALPVKSKHENIPQADLGGKKKIFSLKYSGPQSSMLAVWPGITRSDKDWFAAEVMNYILGGGSFSSRLMSEIREKRGLTYGISSGMANYDHAATYTIQSSFKNEKAGEVFDLIKKEITRMKETQVTDAELKAAKDYLIGSYALGLTSTSRVAGHFMEIQRENLSADYQRIHEAGINAVTAQDVQRVARRILADDGMITFFVGEPQGITPSQTFERVD